MIAIARIAPLDKDSAPQRSVELASAHEVSGAKMSNMKWTLAHAPAALRALLEWYPLHEQVVPFLGDRRATLFCHAISTQSDCLICSTFFRRILMDAGEDPDTLGLDEEDELVVAFGMRLAHDPHAVDDELYARLADRYTDEQIVVLTAFGAIMIATNVFNDALQVPLDSHLEPYRAQSAIGPQRSSRAPPTDRATPRASPSPTRDTTSSRSTSPSSAYPGYAMGTSEELEALHAKCEESGAACLTAVADVRDDAAVSAAVDAAVATFGRVDVLFNNAGICAYGLAHELTETEWDTMLDINLKGPWIVARRVIPHMIAAGRGVIVNNSSVAGLRGMGRLSHYAASKWGLTGLTKSWAIELAPHGIRVVAIHPTGVDTPLNDGIAALEGSTPLEIAERSAGNLLPVPVD